MRRFLARAFEVLLIAFAVGALGMYCSIPSTRALASENPTTTAFIDLRRDEAAAAGKKFDLKWEWRPIGKISRYLRAAVIYAEDYNFYRHDGVDWDAIENAVEANWNKGAMAVGGSTISQQLAKNLYLSPNRSMLRKVREMFITFSLEDHLSKQRILELYLNVAEWGDGVFGAEAAAKKWFGHSAQFLSPAEAVRLAIALPNPIKRAPNVRDAELTKKAVRIIRLLRMQGLIDSAQERAALDQVGAPEERVLPSRPEPGMPAPPAIVTPPEPAKPDDAGSGESKPEPTEPSKAEPSKAGEPSGSSEPRTEPSKTEPRTEPTKTEPSKIEPSTTAPTSESPAP